MRQRPCSLQKDSSLIKTEESIIKMVSRSSKQVVPVVKKVARPVRGKRLVSRDPVATKTTKPVSTEVHRRMSIDLETKVAMIKAMEVANVKQIHVAKKFGVPTPTLCTILKNKDTILDFYENRNMDPSRMRMRKAARPDMDDAVFKWYQECVDKNEHINGPLLMKKAAQVALKLGHGKIKVSDGWLERFKFRHNIYFTSSRRSSTNADDSEYKSRSSKRSTNHKSKRSAENRPSKSNIDHKSKGKRNTDHKSTKTHINVIRAEAISPPPTEDDAIDVSFVYDPSDETIHDEGEIMEQEDVDVSLKYGPSDTFHAQEMSLFYHLQPQDTHQVMGKRFSGGERSEERLTVLFCCNASGTEKLPPLVVGSHPIPRRLADAAYESNCHSWMTQSIFRKWLQDLDNHVDRRVALVVDDTPVHAVSVPMQKVHVFWAPPNHMHSRATSVISNLVKIHYRKNFLVKDDNKKFNPFILRDAVDMLCSAWEQVTSEEIGACFDNDPASNSLVAKLAESLRDSVLESLPTEVTLLDYATSDGEAFVAADLAGAGEIVPEQHHHNPYNDVERSRAEEQVVAVIPVLKKFVYAQDDKPNEVLKALSVLENYVHRKTLR